MAEQLDVVLPVGVGVAVPKTLSSTSTFQPTAPASALAAPAGSTYGTSARPEPFYYWFLDSAGVRTRFRDSAAVNFDSAVDRSDPEGVSLQWRANSRSALLYFIYCFVSNRGQSICGLPHRVLGAAAHA